VWWPGAGSNRRPFDFQLQVHLIGVRLPGILLALVRLRRRQKHRDDWSYWTVHWTPFSGRSDKRRASRRAARHLAALSRGGFHPDCYKHLIEVTVDPEQDPIHDRKLSGRSDGDLEGDCLGIAVVVARVAF
jgi:hypothetical protein